MQDNARAQARLSVSSPTARAGGSWAVCFWVMLYVALTWTPGDGACDPTRFLHGKIQEQNFLLNNDTKPTSPELLPTGLILSAEAFKQNKAK